MKILNSLSNFLWVFIAIGLILGKITFFPEEQTPHEPFSFNKFTYQVGEYVISLVVTGVVLLVVYKIAVWVESRKRVSEPN